MNEAVAFPLPQECPYCFEAVRKEATRCSHCSGEICFCPRCKKTVAVDIKRKWVGVFRGGTQDVKKCRDCEKQLTGPWF